MPAEETLATAHASYGDHDCGPRGPSVGQLALPLASSERREPWQGEADTLAFEGLLQPRGCIRCVATAISRSCSGKVNDDA